MARRTGRTTRMINEAKDARARGELVWVVAHRASYARELANRVIDPDGEPDRTRVHSADYGVFWSDWENASRSIVARRAPIFVDHFAFEVGRPNPELWDVLRRCDDREWTRVSRLSPLDVLTDVEVDQVGINGDRVSLIFRAWVGLYVRGEWRITTDDLAVIADKMETIGHARARDFRQAWTNAMGMTGSIILKAGTLTG